MAVPDARFQRVRSSEGVVAAAWIDARSTPGHLRDESVFITALSMGE